MMAETVSFLSGSILFLSVIALIWMLTFDKPISFHVANEGESIPSPAELNTMDCQGGQ